MSTDINGILKNKMINGWRLFGLLAVPVSALVIFKALQTDLSTGEGISEMIGYSVRWAVPFLFITIAASSMPVLFPGPVSFWWMRNRKYLGLVFAVAMAWQGLFIFVVSSVFRDYYFEEIYFFRDELEGTIGYVFLAAMIATSFQFGRKHFNSDQWSLIHTAGIVFLWAYAFSVYWWNLYYYPTIEPYSAPVLHDYIFYWMGFAAFAVRIAAWGKKRYLAQKGSAAGADAPLILKVIGGALIVLGLVVSATGQLWWESVYGFLAGPSWSEEMIVWLPFWPLEPFLSLILMGLGVYVATLQTARAPSTQEAGQAL